jgi:Ala-tRNA(Pro) deacylase
MGAMLASPDDLFAYFDSLGIAHSTEWHEALFTVDQSAGLKARMPGAHTKNLFLKDAEGTLVLIAAEAHNQLKLNQLHKIIGTKRLSFGSAELMTEVLGVMPGSVTAFALMNDRAGRVRFLVDAVLAAAEVVNFHPLVNTGTTAISQADFRRFVGATGHRFEIIDFSPL